jgi:hypothetical protein
MLAPMRRLHLRGSDSRGVVVDADGAMLGPACVLVRCTQSGFRCVAPGEAAAIEAAVLGPGHDPGWLFEQSRRIAQALATGETALAQIYGLRIPVGDFDGAALRRLAAAARLIKANFNPDQLRIPQGEPGAGQWTDEGNPAEPAPSSGASRTGRDGEPPPEAGGDESPPIEYKPGIPAEPPDTAKGRNSIVRRSAEWLRQAAALGVAFAPDARVKAVLAAIETTAWIAEYLPEIRSYYLDGPKSPQELQNAVDDPQPGYQVHHIVEGQYNSANPEANARRFANQLEGRDNLVRIPKWTHVEISSWYSTKNDDYGGMTPRAYLRGKSWNEQYDVGLRALRRVGVLK